MRFIDFESEPFQVWGIILIFLISLFVCSYYLAKKNRQGVEVVEANGSVSIECNSGLFWAGRALLPTKAYILKEGSWYISETPFKAIWKDHGKKFLPENCRIKED